MNNINDNAEACINSLDIYIDVLKEESVKLSNMITKLNDRIKEIEAEKERLVKEQSEPEFEKVGHGEPYFYIYGNNMNVAVSSDDSDHTSEVCYMHNNYFHTKKRAQEVADKIKFLLKLERLHDIYCPCHKPNWNSFTERKYFVLFGHETKKWEVNWCQTFSPSGTVYFPTKEITQKVCDILNEELKQDSAH